MNSSRNTPKALRQAVVYSVVCVLSFACTSKTPPPNVTPPEKIQPAPSLSPMETLESLEKAAAEAEGFFHDFADALAQDDRARLRDLVPERLSLGVFPPASKGNESPWRSTSSAVAQTRQTLVQGFEGLRGESRNLISLRIKLNSVDKAADGSLRGTLTCKLISRVSQTGRRWVRMQVNYELQPQEAGWQLTAFDPQTARNFAAREALFEERSLETGISRTPALSPVGNRDSNIAYGGATGDLNNDGILDIVALSRDRSYLYLGGAKGFREYAKEAGLHGPFRDLIPTAVLMVDYDNDGDRDLFLSGVGKLRLLRNEIIPDGTLKFVDSSKTLGVDREIYGMSVVSVDLNRDRQPDFYIAAYGDEKRQPPNRHDYATNGNPNLLLLSQKDGSYLEVAQAWGVDNRGWSLAAAFADVDEDGDQDLYVANDFGGGDVLYLNQGSRFEKAEHLTQVLGRGFGMGVSFGDYDNDGDLDLHVTNMSSNAGHRVLQRLPGDTLEDLAMLKRMTQGNLLYENLGKGQFKDVSQSAGPFPGGWAWGGGFLDFDNDGDLDLHTPNGFLSGRAYNDT